MKDYSNVPMIIQPPKLNIKLFPHQLAIIYQMEKLEQEQIVEYGEFIKETRLGINADATGCGKTYSMIGLIVRDKMAWDLNTPFTIENIIPEAGGIIKKRTITRLDKLPCTLILVSPSIINQWVEELGHTDLNVEIIISKKDIDCSKVEICDVVLVTVSMYNYLIMSYPNFVWKRFIFDEPGHIRVSGMKDIQAGFYWFLTATPNAIITKHYNCRGGMMKNIIGDNWEDFETQFAGMIIKNDPEFTNFSFQLPPVQNYYYDCLESICTVVSGMVNPAIKTMIEAGNIGGAITALGGTKTKNITELVQRKKLEEIENISAKIRIYQLREEESKIQELQHKKLRLENQLKELQDRFNSILCNPCHICTEKITDPILEPDCQNLFCGNCLLTWLQCHNSCPTCRAVIKLDELIYVTIPENICTSYNNGADKLMSKTDKIVDLIKNKKTGKFLIFSAYDATFVPICKLLKENNFKFVKIEGNVHTRQKNVNLFKYGSTNIILLNSNFNSAGINLQETTDIILYHSMPSSTKNQIIGRAQRIGRVEHLYIHHLQVGI